MYPDITNYRENYVLNTVKEQGYIHLGLGCRIYSDKPEEDIRTINNATIQFWSIISLLAINELHHRIKENNLEEDIKITSSIYDAIYFEIREDSEIIKWLNKNVVETMTVEVFKNEIIHNECELDIGRNWSDVTTLQNNVSIEDIDKILKEI